MLGVATSLHGLRQRAQPPAFALHCMCIDYPYYDDNYYYDVASFAFHCVRIGYCQPTFANSAACYMHCPAFALARARALASLQCMLWSPGSSLTVHPSFGQCKQVKCPPATLAATNGSSAAYSRPRPGSGGPGGAAAPSPLPLWRRLPARSTHSPLCP